MGESDGIEIKKLEDFGKVGYHEQIVRINGKPYAVKELPPKIRNRKNTLELID